MILIVTEGARTEPLYFNALRAEYKLSQVEVEVVGEGASPITVVDKAITLRDERARNVRRAERRSELAELAFDEVWCVFDVEVPHENVSFNQAVDKAEAQRIKLAVSNPAFEFWFLLHFVYTTRSFLNADDVRHALLVHIPAYEKHVSCFPHLRSRLQGAITNAERILSAASEEAFPHPSTTVHLLARTIRDMSIR